MKLETAIAQLEENTINSLDLTNQQINAEDIERLIQALKTNQTLTVLNLRENCIQDKGAQKLAEMLKTNRSLTTLNIENNQIGDLGTQALAEALIVNKTLSSLNLFNNQLSHQAGFALSELLQTTETLCSLDLGFNQLGDEGAQAIAKALKINQTLSYLSLEKNQITDLGISSLTETLKVNQTLTFVHIIANEVKETTLKSYEAAWEAHQTRQLEMEKAAREGDENTLVNFFTQYSAFPLNTLGLLIQHQHKTLITRWQAYWSLAALKIQDKDGNTPLHLAIFKQMDQVITWLVTKGAPLTIFNEANRSPLMLLETYPSLEAESYYKIANYYLTEPNINLHKAIQYCDQAVGLKHTQATCLLELMQLLNHKLDINSPTIKQAKNINDKLAVLTKENIAELIALIATPNGMLKSCFIQEKTTLFHLAAWLGSSTWFEVADTFLKRIQPTSTLILREDDQQLLPAALASTLTKFIASEKQIKLSSLAAQEDPLLQSYRNCELALRQAEKRAELDLLLVSQRDEHKVRLHYSYKEELLKDNIRSLAWQPENVAQELIIGYANVLQQLWRAKTTFLSLSYRAKEIWPQNFDPFLIQTPPETIKALSQNPPFMLKMQVKMKGQLAYISYYITCIEQWYKAYVGEALSEENNNAVKNAFVQLITAYKQYENLWKNALTETERRWLLTSPTLMLQADSLPLFINPNPTLNDKLSAAEKLNYFLNGEKIEGMVGAGTSPVFSIKGVHYKRNPHAPGIEFMVSSLGKLLPSESTLPIALLKVIGQDGLPYTYQASHSIVGKDLGILLRNYPEHIDKIRLDNFSALVILSLLTDPQDGKPDNYLTEFSQNPEGKITHIDLISFDNDISFSDAIISRNFGERKGEYTMNIKSTLYFLPQMMQSIDEDFCTAFLAKPAEYLLLEWLTLLFLKNKEYETLLTTGIFHSTEYAGDGFTSKRGLQLPIKLVPETLLRFYRKLKQLYTILAEQPKTTLWELLMKVEPEVGLHYAKLKQQYPDETLGCDIMRCIIALYEDSFENGKELLQLRNELDAQYLSDNILKTPEEFAFEEKRTLSLKDSLFNLLRHLKYEDFQGDLAKSLYQILNKCMQAAGLEDFLTVALAHNCVECIYWLWQENLIEPTIIQETCENLKKYSLLHFFTQNKHLTGIKLLLIQSTYPVNVTNGQGYTPLHMAAAIGDLAIVEYLTQQGADARAKTILLKTPLALAESRCKQMNEACSNSGDEKYQAIITYLRKCEVTFVRNVKEVTNSSVPFIGRRDSSVETLSSRNSKTPGKNQGNC